MMGQGGREGGNEGELDLTESKWMKEERMDDRVLEGEEDHEERGNC